MKARHQLEHQIYNSFQRLNSCWKLTHHELKRELERELERELLREMKIEGILFIVAVSGGRDSLCLLHAMTRVFKKDQLVVAHFHHGDFTNKEHRDQALHKVQSVASHYQLKFEFEKSLLDLNSEAECRTHRYYFFAKIANKYQTNMIVLAQHQDDWLETQLIKLIRGCSFKSLNKNSEISEHRVSIKETETDVSEVKILKWRPWIRVSSEQIREYAETEHISFVEDPTNHRTNHFRNWIRNHWLKELEQYRPGAKRSLSYSLIHSLEEVDPLKKNKNRREFPWCWKSNSLSRIFYESLNQEQKRQCLAYFFYRKNWPDVRRTQIDEMIKVLDKNQNSLKLKFKNFEVQVDAGQILIKKSL